MKKIYIAPKINTQQLKTNMFTTQISNIDENGEILLAAWTCPCSNVIAPCNDCQ